MHANTLQKWQHSHDFRVDNIQGEMQTRRVLLLTGSMMLIEIVAGFAYGSMALLADGWHMGTHVAAFAITLFAYQYARRYAQHPQFSFGTGKVNVLGGFASAVALAVVALIIGLESIQRLIHPENIHFNEALIVAVLGLLVNLFSAWLLRDHHHHHHEHDHPAHDHHEHEHDHNLRAAYFHVLADALTSILAIIALLIGKYAGIIWIDAAMGLVGMGIIMVWALGLLKETSPILLDRNLNDPLRKKIQQKIEQDLDNRVVDLHVWQISPNHYAAIVVLVTDSPQESSYYKQLLHEFELAHLSIEVIRCEEQCVQLNLAK
ncbi:cation transporter [Thioflexithrix psekupsensis]|uniref:Cation transporter n=2 Tax=Thioflexithrix psekupsensis TaxID=1570016 RepID=A0A251X7M9_9GAMM|nr:cation transporter [Thioflexithrix psekupsensis]